MARKVAQLVRRGARTWLVRLYKGRDPDRKKRKILTDGKPSEIAGDVTR
jgi:hypothetical protein